MKKENRIKKRKEFNYIFKNGEVFSSRFINLLVTSSWVNRYKVGFSSGKKVGNAVVRNKVKRRIKEAVYSSRDLLKSKVNYIFVAKSNSSEASYEEIKNNVIYLLNKFNEKNDKVKKDKINEENDKVDLEKSNKD